MTSPFDQTSRRVPVLRFGPQLPGSLVWLTAGILALAAALRVPGLFTDFWLDEIWSYEEFARHATSVRDIFLAQALKHDNNQHLNTLFMYWLRDHPGWFVYRLPSFVAGLLTVAVATLVGNRRSRIEGLFSGVLVASSFMMVVYSTEARGYALMLFFVLLGFAALQRYLDAPAKPAAVLFWICVAMGLASHSSISHFYLGAVLWSGYRLRGRTRDLAWLHGVPIVWAIAWAIVVLWGSRIGGGDPWQWRLIADESLAWTVGYPLSTVPPAGAIAVAVALVIWDAWRLWTEGSDEGLFYVGAILGPPLFVAALGPPWLFPRYFLVSLLFFLMVLARALARLTRGPVWAKALSAVLVLLFVIGNVREIVPFSRYGRGGASQAVRDIVASTSSPVILVTSPTVDIRSVLPITFYQRKLSLGDRIRFVSWKDLLKRPGTGDAIDWIIVQSQAHAPLPETRMALPSGESYGLRKSYPAYGPSGIHWFLYSRER